MLLRAHATAVRPRILASEAALVCNARPTPEIFALPVVVDVQVAVVEGDADDWEAQPFSDKIGKKSHAR